MPTPLSPAPMIATSWSTVPTVIPGGSYTHVGSPSPGDEAEQVSRDVADLDLLGALGDAVASVVAVDVLERLPARVAQPTVDLHRAVGGIADEPVGTEVAHRDLVADAADAIARVHLARGLAHERTQQLHVGRELDQRPLDRLALGQGLPERDSLLGVRDALAHAVVGRSDARGRLADAVLVHEEHRRRETAALLAEDR